MKSSRYPTGPTKEPPSESASAIEEEKLAAAEKIRTELNKQPAQVTPQMKKVAEEHPTEVPPPGDLGPDQGPSS